MGRHVPAPRKRFEIAADKLTGPGLVEASGNAEHGVVGAVIIVVEIAGILQGQAADVVLRSGEGMPEGEIFIKQQVEGGQTGQVGFALPALAELFEKVPADLFKTILLHFQKTHAVGFQPEGQGQLVGGNGLIKEGPFLVGGGAEGPANPVDKVDVLMLGNVGRTLEHEVFEQRGQSGLARRFVDRSGLVGHDDRNKRQPIVL